MSQRQRRAQLPGEPNEAYAKRIEALRERDLEVKRAKRERRPGESQSDFDARVAEQRRAEAKRKRLARNGDDDALRNDSVVASPQECPSVGGTDGQKRPSVGGTDGQNVLLSACPSVGGQTDGNVLLSPRQTREITQDSDDVRLSSEFSFASADVRAPSLKGGGPGQTSAGCPSVPMSVCPPTDGHDVRLSPEPDDAPSDLNQSTVGERLGSPDKLRGASVISLFGPSRTAAPEDWHEREDVLWRRVLQLEAQLASVMADVQRVGAALEVLRGAVVHALVAPRPQAEPPASQRAPVAAEQDVPAWAETAENSPPVPIERVDDLTRRTLVAVWQSMVARRLYGHRMQDVPALLEVDVLALEQLWRQALDFALGDLPRSQDLFHLWLDEFLLNREELPKDQARSPQTLYIRSHLLPRRIREGLCPNWPPLLPADDDYVPMSDFAMDLAEWEQSIAAFEQPEAIRVGL